MAQTTGAINSANAVIEVSADNSTWKDISGSTVSLDTGTQTLVTGSKTTVDGDLPIVLSGKKQMMDITFQVLWTDVSEEGQDFFEDAALTKPPTVYTRIFPEGKASGNVMYSSGKGMIKSFGSAPKIDSAAAEPIASQIVVSIPGWTKGTYTTA